MATNNFKFAQVQNFALSGAGVTAGATTIILRSFAQIDGTLLTMTNFGSIGYGTLEPGNGTLEEQISFTGVTQNANGTATLTGVKSVLDVAPYTESSGLGQTHAGSTVFVISNTAGFYNKLLAKDTDGTVTATYTFTTPNYPQVDNSATFPTLNAQFATKAYADSLTFAGAPNATTTQKGIVELATQAEIDAKTATGGTGASLVPTPDLNRWVLGSDYVVDTGSANAYAIAPSPAISAYTTGQIFSFKAVNANTTTSTLNVNGLGLKTIKKNDGTIASDLRAGDILAGQIVMVEYDGTNFQLITALHPQQIQNGNFVYAASSTGNDTYVITVAPTPVAYVTGQKFSFKADVGNTGTASLNVNSLGAVTLKKNVSTNLATGDIAAGQMVDVEYDGTNFQLQSRTSVVVGNRLDINLTPFTGANSTLEQTVYTYTVPGGTLGTANGIRTRFYVSAISNNATTVTLRFKYGGTNIVSYSFPADGGAITVGVFEFLVAASGATGTQAGEVSISTGTSGLATGNHAVFAISSGTAAIDSTADQALLLSIQSASGTAYTFTLDKVVTELISY